ncbi:transmembrane emp24 domain-containing protein 9 [Dicentrarchus labrax]|uniref:GOLD domain-containing protein n=1 Tax=Dicentrarchus labrax TaxID=13489 RepID=A0A8P4KTJ1_DICLA|nr:transmembrane emp24 domain-containing protein 9 [Dicentrarchus labrax]
MSVGLLSVVFFLNVSCNFVSSLFVNIRDTESQCFIQEVPEDTVIIGNFRLTDKPANQSVGILVEAKDPDDRLVLSRRYGAEGSFKFTSCNPGRYQICLQSISSQRPLSAGGLLAVHLHIRAGERTNNYTEIAAKYRLTELELRVQQLREQVEQILLELNYQRLREERFREVDHRTNMWIFWWPVVRSLYVVAAVTWTRVHSSIRPPPVFLLDG